ncbi:hypothetical protein ANO11243_022160 [Dothideomycetidae sp. 11243]|nr:hypothetical protein ANO11243_022160 [fungal sp. No.11243]
MAETDGLVPPTLQKRQLQIEPRVVDVYRQARAKGTSAGHYTNDSSGTLRVKLGRDDSGLVGTGSIDLVDAQPTQRGAQSFVFGSTTPRLEHFRNIVFAYRFGFSWR